MKITGALAVALLLGNVSAFDMNTKFQSEQQVVDLVKMTKKGLKFANSEEAQTAQRNYTDKLVAWHHSLPTGDGHTYAKTVYDQGMDVKACYEAWVKKSGEKMEYIDSDSWAEEFAKEKEASNKLNATIAAEKKAAEEKAKKEAEEKAKKEAEEKAKKEAEEKAKKEAEDKEADDKPEEETPAEEELSLESEPKVEKTEKEKEEEKIIKAFAEFEDLNNAGLKFDNLVFNSVENLGKGELSRAKEFYPEIVAAMEADGSYDGLEQYIKVVEHNEVPVEEFTAALDALKAAKYKWEKFMDDTDGLKQFKADPLFEPVFLRGIARFKGIPSLQEAKDRLEMHMKPKPDKYVPILEKLVAYIDAMADVKREEANKLFMTAIDKIAEWAKAGKTMDAMLVKIQKDFELHAASDKVMRVSNSMTEAIKQRKELYAVWKALGDLNEANEVYMGKATKFQKDLDTENSANIALIIILVLLVVLSIGGVVYCKTQKKCCFAEQDEVSAEGGDSDKTLFKKEIKSKSSKKKNNKESLMPTFQVAEEEA